jgi:hypothetical protein
VSAPSKRLLVLLCGATLAGCPLPQTLPEYPKNGPITPPRIQMDQVAPIDTMLLVDANCGAGSPPVPSPLFTMRATLVDENTYEKVEARWFVDYDPLTEKAKPDIPPIFIDGPADGVTIERHFPSNYSFEPYRYDSQAFRDGGGLHVVELVVSNNFAPEPIPPEPALARPWRTPLTTSTQQFETQFFRWIFHYVPTGTPGASCGYTAPPP